MSFYEPADENPPIGPAIAKVAIGLLFMVVALKPDDDFEAGSRGVGIVLALALIVWGLLPHFLAWRHRRRMEAEEHESAERARLAAEEAAARAARRAWKCPYCGAVAHGDTCEYCGAPSS